MLSTCLYCLSRFADFQGRSDRREYWVFSLAQFVLFLGIGLLLGAIGAVSGADVTEGSLLNGLASVLLGLLSLLLFMPTLAVTIRRLHDGDRTGWFILLGLIPFGIFLLIILLALPGDEGSNRFGPPPTSEQPFVA